MRARYRPGAPTGGPPTPRPHAGDPRTFHPMVPAGRENAAPEAALSA